MNWVGAGCGTRPIQSGWNVLHDFRQLVATGNTTQLLSTASASLKIIASGVLFRETSLRAHGAVTPGRERAFDDVGFTQMFPLLAEKFMANGVGDWLGEAMATF